jgi:hypothetical protein
MALECRLPDYANTKRILFPGTASGFLPVHAVHKNAEIGSTGQTGRKSKNRLYSSVFDVIFLEIRD